MSALVQLTKKAFIAFGILQNIPDSTVRTRARGTVKRATVRVDRGDTCKEKDLSRVEVSTLPLRMLLRKSCPVGSTVIYDQSVPVNCGYRLKVTTWSQDATDSVWFRGDCKRMER